MNEVDESEVDDDDDDGLSGERIGEGTMRRLSLEGSSRADMTAFSVDVLS